MSLAAHYTRQARTPGWYAYSRRQVHELDADKSGLFAGLRAAVAKNLTGFAVPQNERGDWWLMLSEAERGVEIFLPREPVVVYAEKKRGRK
jgi:hypothetical protein